MTTSTRTNLSILTSTLEALLDEARYDVARFAGAGSDLDRAEFELARIERAIAGDAEAVLTQLVAEARDDVADAEGRGGSDLDVAQFNLERCSAALAVARQHPGAW